MNHLPQPPLWPSWPLPGEYVEVPMDLPPGLLEAIGYTGGARFVCLLWTRQPPGVMFSDSEFALTANAPAWSLFANHARVRPLLEPYESRSSFGDPPYALLADRWVESLSIGLTDDVSRLVNSQPSGLHADAAQRGGTDEALLDAIEARLTRPNPAGSDRSVLVDRMLAFLNALPGDPSGAVTAET